MMLTITAALALGFAPTAWKTASAGPKVSGHAASIGPDGGVYCFGGLTGSAGSPCTAELWRFSDDKWEHLKTTGGGPGPRMYSASAVLNSNFYLIGGWDPEGPGSGGTFKDEVWKLDLKRLSWEALAPIPCGAVSRHAACTVGDRVLVHTFRGLFVLDEASGTLREQPTHGDTPGAVSMCAFSCLASHEALLFGGSTKTQEMTADAHVLDIGTWTWRKLRRDGDGGPSPRASACAAPLAAAAKQDEGPSCIVFGGAGLGGGGYDGGRGLVAFDETWRLRVDGDVARWEQVADAASDGGASPRARVAASLSALPAGRGLLLHGGWDPASKETFEASSVLMM